MALELLNDENLTIIHRRHQDALGSEQIVVSFLLLGLLDLLHDERKVLRRSLLDHRLIDEILLRLNPLNSIDSLGNRIVALLSQEFVILSRSSLTL